MGHVAAKDVYRSLGGKLDSLTCRLPWNQQLRSLLRELYTAQEADLVANMAPGLSDLKRLSGISGLPEDRLRGLLEGLADRGLVMDIWSGGRYRYAPSPFVIGVFEFTLMRTRGRLDTKTWARLFRDYLDEGSFFKANLSRGDKVSVLRALPHEAALSGAHLEILDHEKASALIESSPRCAVALCACRHEKQHLGTKTCSVPLETCTAFGTGADYLIRHGLAREASRSEMRDLFAASRDRRLALCADNVKRRISYVCHCCKCCCTALEGITKHGYPNAVVSSGFIARPTGKDCTGCGACVKACPVNAIKAPDRNLHVDPAWCLGCGVCVLACGQKALGLQRRAQKVFTPASIFEKVILMALEKGNLQNFVFDDPKKATHRWLRGFLGGFLRLDPVRRALASDRLRSGFLKAIRSGAGLSGADALD
ncbi:MAG: 4Fe-4S binding protein [Elusimicrobiota bacterium]|jgi:Pyruvate/2-oxoacid:ferredoxin oxidoreductase delta subunit